ncbi:MAG: winged helix-turn-helix domain-containing protein [Acidobacteriota bacterium]|nr:winged helix-turn-helix domain-containing protein [Acidobacteriota bacterium]
MPQKIVLKNHLSVDDLFGRYRRCQNPAEKIRWKALYLIAKGRVANHAAKRVGRSSGWMTNLARRYNAKGEKAVLSKAPASEHKFALAREQEAELERLIDSGSSPDGGLWTGSKVCAWINERIGRLVHPVTGWRVLKRLEFSLQVPRPTHTKAANEEERNEFKKTSARRLES